MKDYLNLFFLGVSLSWGPCVGFCAPILFPYITATQKDWLSGLKVSLVFSLTRVLAYMILSLISAALGQYLIRRFYQSQAGMLVDLAAGIFICLLGIIIILGRVKHGKICSPCPESKAGHIRKTALLGLLLGFSPCLPLLGLLTYITFNAKGSFHGMLMGLIFGLGTIISPLILLGPLSGQTAKFLSNKETISKIVGSICGLILVYFGITIIVRAVVQ